MSSSTSSAEWPKLYRYSDRALQIDRELAAEANRIAGILRNFEATCTEYRVSVSHLAGEIQGYASRAEGTDVWVRQVGVDFQRADQIGAIQSRSQNLFDFLKDVVILDRAARAGFSSGLRFRPYPGWSAFFRDTIFKLGYTGKWTVTGSRSALRAGGIAKNVRWFSYKYLTKQLTVKPGPLASEANSILRKLPRNSPYLPVATFKQRIADVFGVGKSIGGKLKSAAGIGILLTVAANIYEFQWGVNRHLGLRSRQFVTSTVADGSATLGIITVSTAVGSLIPVPFLGTVAGFIVGVGLAYAYDRWGKDAWRNAVDGAGKRLADAFTSVRRAVQEQLYKEQGKIARGAAETGRQVPSTSPAISVPPSISQSDLVLKGSPVPWGKVTSINWYGNTQYAHNHRDKLYGELQGFHSGIDFGAPKGTPITSEFDRSGKVISVDGKPYKYLGGSDQRSILVDYGDYLVLYAHTSRSEVKVGDDVKPGDTLGAVGVSNDFPHLHLEVIKKDPNWDDLPEEKQRTTRPGDVRTNPVPYFDKQFREQMESKEWDGFYQNADKKWLTPDDQPDIHPGGEMLL